jgi:hypothetical protein
MGFTDWVANTFYGADELTAESAALDERRNALNQKAAEKYGDEWYQDTLNNDAAGRVNATDEIGSEFSADSLQRNLEESTGTAAGWARSIIGAPLSFVFGAIPPLGWLLLAGVVFWWIGGPAWLRGILGRRAT